MAYGRKDMKKLQRKLQKRIGPSPKIQVGGFRNWAGTQVKQRVLLSWPTTVADVRSLVLAARALRLRVRAVGQGHSWSPLFADEGQLLLCTGHLTRPDGPPMELIQNPSRPEVKYVTVAASVTSAQFKEFQLSHGVCLPTNVILGGVQMGGAVATGCHSAGWDARTISDYVVSMRIVDSDGELREFSQEKDPEQLKAVQCNLGLWGIVVDITFKVEPTIIVESRNEWFKVKDLFYDQERLQKLLSDNWSVEFFWFPFNGITGTEAIEAFMEGSLDLGEWDPLEDEVWVRTINRPQRITGPLVAAHTYEIMQMRSWWQMKGFNMVEGFVSRFPQAAPSFLKSQIPHLKQQFKGSLTQPLPHAVHFLSNVEEVPVNEMEWAFSLDEDCKNLCVAIQKVVQLVHAEALAGRFPMNLPLELRFIGDSGALLSPAGGANPENGGSGHTCYIEVLTVAGTPGWDAFSQQVAAIWRTLSGSRPHWAKEWEHLDDIDNLIRERYAPQIQRFLNALERSKVDPDGVFFNERLEKIFYPQGHPGRSLPVSEKNDSEVIEDARQPCKLQ